MVVTLADGATQCTVATAIRIPTIPLMLRTSREDTLDRTTGRRHHGGGLRFAASRPGGG